VNEATVRRVALRLPGPPRVVSVNPTDLAGVFAMFDEVADLLDARAEAEALRAAFDDLGELIVERAGDKDRPRVVLLEWLDPPFSSGHWNPEIVALAGGVEVLARPGKRSRRIGWDDVAAGDPEVILLSPCGFTLDRAVSEWEAVRERAEWRSLEAGRTGRVGIVDGSAYFSRPGPRLKQSLAIAAAIIHPDACHDLAPADGFRLVSS
jgi:iron complex transport system substrate-binding protein